MAADARSVVASAAVRPPTLLHVAVLAPVARVEAGGVDDGLEGDPCYMMFKDRKLLILKIN